MADFKFKYCSYAVRVAPSVARRRKGSGEIFPSVALVEQISSLLSPEKAAEGETLRHMSRTTTTHAYHLPVQNPARAGARGAGGGVSTPAKKHRFCAQPRRQITVIGQAVSRRVQGRSSYLFPQLHQVREQKRRFPILHCRCIWAYRQYT